MATKKVARSTVPAQAKRDAMLGGDLEAALEDLDVAATQVFYAEDFNNDAVTRREGLFTVLQRINSARLVVEAACRSLLDPVVDEASHEGQAPESQTRLRAARSS